MISEDKKQYDTFADDYSHFQHDENRYAREAFYKAVDFSFQGTLLDAGCGDGQDLEYYHSQGTQTYGFDSSDEMIKLAKTNSPDSTLIVSSFETTPYEDAFFDIIVSKYAVQHAGMLEDVFKELHRILKKDGILYILVTHPITHFLHQKERDYFKQQEVCLPLFDEKVVVCEPSHSLQEYLSVSILKQFALEWITEGEDIAIKNVLNNAHYPGFLIMKMVKK